jgi:16S rRNA (adenine1518-N6/adenine1519-N6)-dimethyltransferase
MSSAPNWRLDKEIIKRLINDMNLKETVRGEELSVEQFIIMSNIISANDYGK